jgi:hypothetical protein
MDNKEVNTSIEYGSIEEISQDVPLKANERYPWAHPVFMAGDCEQVAQRMHNSNLVRSRSEPVANEMFNERYLPLYMRNGGPTAADRERMFDYLFHTTKKGIFVQFRGGKLVNFLPFTKYNYENQWGGSLCAADRWEDIEHILKYSQEQVGRRFVKRRFHFDQNAWIGNGFLVRNAFPVREGDTNITCLKHMFKQLGESPSHSVPDCDFYLNRRDFPVLRKDGYHPYPDLAGKRSPKIKVPDNPFPVLSMCSHPDYADIPCVTHDLWKTIAYMEYEETVFRSTYQGRTHRTFEKLSDGERLVDKLPQAVFRGASTGQGTTVDTNVRLRLANMNKDSDLLDVGITTWNMRPRIVGRTPPEENFPYGRGVLDTISQRDLDFGLVNHLTPKQQAKYRYIINVNGHVCAFRLSYEFSSGSVVLLADSEYKLWFSDRIEPFEHYVPVKADLSDLIEKIKWCEDNLEEAQRIADNALLFYNTHLTKKGVFDYLTDLLSQMEPIYDRLSYNAISVQDLLGRMERNYFSKHLDRFKCDWGGGEWVSSAPIPNLSTFEQTCLHTSKSSSIMLLTNKSKSLKIKYSHPSKSRELEHEVFVRMALEQNIPESQSYIKDHLISFVGLRYGEEGPDASLWDYSNGQTLQEWLVSDNFDLNQFRDITCQVCGVLQVLQEICGFSHGDLYPYNILLEEGAAETRTYYTSRGTVISRGIYKVRFVDYGKSQILVNGKKRRYLHGTVRPFYFSTVLDVISFSITCINRLLSKRLDWFVLPYLFRMSKFFSNSEYYPGSFSTVRDLKRFTSRARKYTEMLYSEKGELEHRSPIDFLIHMSDNEHKLVHDKKILDRPPPCFLFREEDLKSVHDIEDAVNRIQDYVSRLGKQQVSTLEECRINTFKKLARVILTMNERKKVIVDYPVEDLLDKLKNLI